jgi:hypothetical protein
MEDNGMKSHKPKAFYAGCAILSIFVFLVTSPCWADIYKWKDASGKTHFTDNLMVIPDNSRTEKHLEEMRMRGLIDPEAEDRKKQLKIFKERRRLEKEQAAKRQRSEKKKSTISQEERKVLANTSFFLKNNVIAYNKHLSKPIGEELFKNIKKITQISIKPKTELIDQLSRFESPVAKQTLKLLQASLATDNEFEKTKVYIKPSAEPLITRLKNDTVDQRNIIKLIKRVLDSSQS